MVFSSTIFLSMFLPLVLALYFLAQERLRNYVLLGASLLFYAWGEPKAVWIMIALIILSWFVARKMDKTCGKARKLWLAAGVCGNLSAFCCGICFCHDQHLFSVYLF